MAKTARDIMTVPVVSITGSATLKEAAELLSNQDFSGVPVVDEQNKLIGILSETDLVRYADQVAVVPLTNLSRWISPHAEMKDLVALRQGIDLLAKTKVAQVMTKKVYTATEDEDVITVARLMNRRKINRVPIVDKEGRLVGIVTRGDLVAYMATL